MQPFGAGGGRLLSRGLDEGKPEAASTMGGMHGRIEQEGMKAAVPGHVDEAYELASVSRPAPGEAPSEHGPEGSWLVARPGCREQGVQLCIRECRADLDGDVLHGACRESELLGLSGILSALGNGLFVVAAELPDGL